MTTLKKASVIKALCFLFRQEIHLLQQPQCFQTGVILRLDFGRSKLSLTEIQCDLMRFVADML